LTGLKNNDVVFDVNMIAIDDIILIDATKIPDQTYKVNDPAILLTVPGYSVVPAIAERKFEYSLVSPTPSFITLVGLD
jgi:predicted SpoU family rRNA methylase